MMNAWRAAYIWSFFALIATSSVALAKINISTTGQHSTISVSVDDVQTISANKSFAKELGEFSKLQLVGVEGYEGVLYNEGMPAIPVVRFYVDGDTSIKVTASKSDEVTKDVLSTRLMPVVASAEKLPGVKQAFVLNKALYATNADYPQQLFDIETIGSIRGQPRQMVTLYPVAYNPVSGEVKMRGEFAVSIDRSINVQAEEEVKADTYAFAVGSTFAQSPALSQYVQLKQQQGFSTVVLVKGQDFTSPETLRNKLRDLYTNSGLKYLLIVGDQEDVAAFPGTAISGVTDHYYRSVDVADYASDINTPDIGVGRVSVRTEAQLEAVLRRYTRYVQESFTNQAWLGQAAFLGTSDSGFYDVAEATHNYVIDTHTTSRGYLGNFPARGQQGGDKLYAITHRANNAAVMTALREGRSIVNYSGHGSETSWAGPSLSQSDVRSLSNPDVIPFVISNACITGKFTIGESFGETWQRHPNGAIMFWGSMVNTLWDEDDILERRMFDAIFQLGKTEIHQFTTYALAELWRQYGGAGYSKYYWEAYVTFGDPAVQLKVQAN